MAESFAKHDTLLDRAMQEFSERFTKEQAQLTRAIVHAANTPDAMILQGELSDSTRSGRVNWPTQLTKDLQSLWVKEVEEFMQMEFRTIMPGGSRDFWFAATDSTYEKLEENHLSLLCRLLARIFFRENIWRDLCLASSDFAIARSTQGPLSIDLMVLWFEENKLARACAKALLGKEFNKLRRRKYQAMYQSLRRHEKRAGDEGMPSSTSFTVKKRKTRQPLDADLEPAPAPQSSGTNRNQEDIDPNHSHAERSSARAQTAGSSDLTGTVSGDGELDIVVLRRIIEQNKITSLALSRPIASHTPTTSTSKRTTSTKHTTAHETSDVSKTSTSGCCNPPQEQQRPSQQAHQRVRLVTSAQLKAQSKKS
eukprot:c19561_g1_i1.p1 GENE.c19561_g1_i1~~c19561_g1_i1.p1  ORF type:complete len:367 (+),score=39.22 c19561_g1_i1:150-1250(+)